MHGLKINLDYSVQSNKIIIPRRYGTRLVFTRGTQVDVTRVSYAIAKAVFGIIAFASVSTARVKAFCILPFMCFDCFH